MNMEKLFIEEANNLRNQIELGELTLGKTELGNGIEKTHILDQEKHVVASLAQEREDDRIIINSNDFNIMLFLEGDDISKTARISFNRLLDSSLKKMKK